MSSDETIQLTADVVAVSHDRDGTWQVLLIRRGAEPHAGSLALPGGHVEHGEPVPEAAARELAEETGLAVEASVLVPVGTYHAPGRDPRGRCVSVAYLAHLPGLPAPTAADDAATAEWMPLHTRHDPAAQLAFDHQTILDEAARLLNPDTTAGAATTLFRHERDAALAERDAAVRAADAIEADRDRLHDRFEALQAEHQKARTSWDRERKRFHTTLST